MTQFTRRGAPIAVAAALLALTACSSSKKSTTSSSTGASTAQASTSASAASPSAPKSSAASTPLSALVLQASDLPNTFKKSAPEADDPNDAVEEAKVAACLGAKNTSGDKSGEAKSSFDQGDNSVTSDVTRFKSAADVTSDVSKLRSPKADQCLQDSARRTLSKGMPAGAKIDSIQLHLTPGPNGGPSNVVAVAQGTVTVTVSGQTVKVYTTAAFITGPRIEAEVDATGVGAPIATAVQQQAIKAVADHVEKG